MPPQPDPDLESAVRTLLRESPGISAAAIAVRLGRARSTVKDVVTRLRGAPAPAPIAPEGNRNCLRCGKRFLSTGPGNRMCDPCRGVSASPYAPDGYTGRGSMTDILTSRR